MGKLYKRDKNGKVLAIAEIVTQPKKMASLGASQKNNVNTRNLIAPPAKEPAVVEKVGKVIQRNTNTAPKATEPPKKMPAKSQPANEITLKQTVTVPDTQKTAAFTNYRKAIEFLQDQATKNGFTITQLEGLIAGEIRTSVLKIAEKIRTELTNH